MPNSLSVLCGGRDIRKNLLAAYFVTIRSGKANMSIRIVIADDHGVVRQGLRMFLSLDPELEVVGEAGTGQEAVEVRFLGKGPYVLL